jgi:hypothetical protein
MEVSCLALSEALIQILQTARFGKVVEVHTVDETLVDSLVEALCVSGDIQEFMNSVFVSQTTARESLSNSCGHFQVHD